MKFVKPGETISEIEVINLSQSGFELWIGEKEFFLSFRDFPWFKEAKVEEIMQVELLNPDHLYWPVLDIDLSIESIEHPERFPLIANHL